MPRVSTSSDLVTFFSTINEENSPEYFIQRGVGSIH
jgi:hypothetical protein